jgi:hypothetical protein
VVVIVLVGDRLALRSASKCSGGRGGGRLPSPLQLPGLLRCGQAGNLPPRGKEVGDAGRCMQCQGQILDLFKGCLLSFDFFSFVRAAAQLLLLLPPPAPMAAIDFKLALLVVGVWTAFVIFGIAQEGLTRTKFGADDDSEGEQFKFTTFLVLLQSIGNAAVAAVLLIFSCVSQRELLLSRRCAAARARSVAHKRCRLAAGTARRPRSAVASRSRSG